MRGIKIPLQDFALKMQGGLMRERGRICGTLRYMHYYTRNALTMVSYQHTIVIVWYILLPYKF